MHMPHFLVVGVPKAGTTALHAALQQHPQLFLPQVKEPKYFLTDGPPPTRGGPGDLETYREHVWRRADYEALFAPVPAGMLTGECTPFYLYDRDAQRRIKAAIPDARLIVIVRDPVERAHSNWTHLWGAVRHRPRLVGQGELTSRRPVRPAARGKGRSRLPPAQRPRPVRRGPGGRGQQRLPDPDLLLRVRRDVPGPRHRPAEQRRPALRGPHDAPADRTRHVRGRQRGNLRLRAGGRADPAWAPHITAAPSTIRPSHS